MLGNSAILILRGTSDKIKNTTAPLLPGLLLYDMNNNYLYCGNNDCIPVNELTPLTTDRLKSPTGSVVTSEIICKANGIEIASDSVILNTKPIQSNLLARLQEIEELDFNKKEGNGFIKWVQLVDGKISAETSDTATTLKVNTTPKIESYSTDVVRGHDIALLNYSTSCDGKGIVKTITQTNGKIAATTSKVIDSSDNLTITAGATLYENFRYLHLNQVQPSAYNNGEVHNGQPFCINAGHLVVDCDATGNIVSLLGYNSLGTQLVYGTNEELISLQWNPSKTADVSSNATITVSDITLLNVASTPVGDTAVLRNTDIEINGRNAYYNAKTSSYGDDNFKYEKLAVWGAKTKSNSRFDVLMGNYGWVNSLRFRHLGTVTYCLGDNGNNAEYTRCILIETPEPFYTNNSSGSSEELGNVNVLNNKYLTIEEIYYKIKNYSSLQCWVWSTDNNSFVPAILYCSTNYKSFCTKHTYINDYYPSWLAIEIYNINNGTKFNRKFGHVLSFKWAAEAGFLNGYSGINLYDEYSKF